MIQLYNLPTANNPEYQAAKAQSDLTIQENLKSIRESFKVLEDSVKKKIGDTIRHAVQK